MPAERIVVGGSVASLVAAEALAEAGGQVRLLLPEHGVGHGFSPLRRDGRTLELGVRLLELSYEDDGGPIPPLRDYHPGLAGHRPYARLVSDWVHARLGDRLREIPRPAMVVDGRLVDDILFTVDLQWLAVALDDEERARMTSEVERALRSAGDPAGVLAPAHAGRLAELSLHDASLANHGPAFHERFIAPLCDKVLPGGARDVLAPLRRQAWAPLFHPATLLEALRGERPAFRPRRTFHTVAPDGCGGLVDEQLRRLEEAPRVRVERAGRLTGLAGAGDRVRMRFSDAGAVAARRPVVGVAADELFAAAGVVYEPERVRTAIAWVELPRAAADRLGHLIHVLDPSNPVLRVSAGGATTTVGHTLLCVELRHDVPVDRLADSARTGLVSAGLVSDDATVTVVASAARPTFASPSRATRDAFARARIGFDRRGLDVELVGGALGLGADQLNEQIVQGIRVGALSS